MKRRAALPIIALLLLAPLATIAQKGNKSISKLRKGLEDVRQSKRATQRKLGQTKESIKDTKVQIGALENRLQTVSSDLDRVGDQLDKEKAEQVRLASEYQKANETVKAKKALVGKRIRSIYMEGKPNVLEFVFGSRSSADLSTREFIATRVQRADRQLFNDFKSARDAALTKKHEQDAVVQRVSNLQRQQEAKQQELNIAQQEKGRYLTQLESKKEGLQNMLDDLEADAASIAGEIRAAEARAREAERRRAAEAKKSGKKYTPPPKHSGGLVRPTGGPITSGFGNRYHPILHYSRLHAGVDFGGGYGAAVYSAGGGTVISAGTRGGYGNCIIIDHGNGTSTVYGHLSRIMVSEGQSVTSHQRIGSIGASGLATGPHLHFEVRINGKPVNPMNYL